MGLLDLLKSDGAPSGDLNPYTIRDISGLGGFNFPQMETPQGIVIHHTGGGGTPEGVMETFKQRGLPAQFIMDREGNIVRALPEGMRGQHIRPSQINGLSNANTLGIEIIAKDDSDVTDAQRASAARWLTETGAQYGIPAANVFGHGEVNSHKQATEGNSIVSAWRGANRLAAPDLGPPAAGGDLPMSQRTLMAYAGRDAPARPQQQTPFEAEIQAASKETGIPAAIIRAQVTQESRFNPNAIGKSGEVGLLQIKPGTAAQPGYGVDPLDPSQLRDPAANIRFGARYLAARAREAGVTDWNDPQQAAKGLMAYNGGGDPNYARNVFQHLNAPASANTQVAGRPLGARNPQIARAAERGRGSLADSFTGSGTPSEGQMPMPPRQVADTTSADNGGILEFLRQQMGQAQDVPAPGPQQPQGGLGGLGGFLAQVGGGQAPQAGPRDIASMIPAAPRDPFGLIGKGAAQNQEWAKEREGRIAIANYLVSKGLPPEAAVAASASPQAVQLYTQDKQRSENVALEREKFDFQKENVRADNKRADDAAMSAPRKILRDLGIEPGHPEYQASYKKLAGMGSGASAEVAQRKTDAEALGLTPDKPAYQSYVLTGKMPREDAQPLSATDKKAIMESDEGVMSAETAIKALRDAKTISPKALGGWGATGKAAIANNLPDWLVPDGLVASPAQGQATADLDNLVTTNALSQMKAIFGGNPTEGERKILLDIQGASGLPDKIRQPIFDRAISMMERKLEFNKQRAGELRGNTYYKAGDRQAQTGAPAAPAPAPSQVQQPAAVPDRAALEAEARRRGLLK